MTRFVHDRNQLEDRVQEREIWTATFKNRMEEGGGDSTEMDEEQCMSVCHFLSRGFGFLNKI